MAATGWTISPTDGASINQSTGVASFSANTSTTEDKVYTITYTNDNGCTGSTTYKVNCGTIAISPKDSSGDSSGSTVNFSATYTP
jgi:hypothetical protein